MKHTPTSTFLQTGDGDDVREWRRELGSKDWSLFRRWHNVSNRWIVKKGDRSYSWVESEGQLELFDDSNSELLYRSQTIVAEDAVPSLHSLAPDHSAFLMYYKKSGSKNYAFHVSWGGNQFEPVDLGPIAREATSVLSFTPGVVALKTNSKGYMFFRVDLESRKMVRLALEGVSRVDTLTWIDDSVIAAGTKVERGGESQTDYRFFLLRARQNPKPLMTTIGIKPGQVQRVDRAGEGVFSVTARGKINTSSAQRTHWFSVANRSVRPLSQVVPGFPKRVHSVDVQAKGQVLSWNALDGTFEHRVREKLLWKPVSDVLGLEFKPRRISSFSGGHGLGSGSHTYWSFFVRKNSKAKFEPAAVSLPNFPKGAYDIEDLRSGLVLVRTLPEGEPLDGATWDPGKHWFARDSAGRWTNIRDLARRHFGKKADLLVDADARSNTLVFYFEDSEGVETREILIQDRDGSYADLQGLIAATAPIPRQRRSVLPSHVLASERFASKGIATITSKREQRESLHLLVQSKQGWVLAGIDEDERQTGYRLEFNRDSGMLERRELKSGLVTFYSMEKDKWQDVRRLIPNPPKKVASAYGFAGGKGLAARSGDANLGMNGGNWQYYLRDHGGTYRSVQGILPGLFSDIGRIGDLGGGQGLSVYEAGDSNSNKVANESRHYFRDGTGWFLLRSSLGLPAELATVRATEDGRVVVAQEDFDSNLNDIEHEWFVGYRHTRAERFKPLASVVGAIPPGLQRVDSLWDGAGLVMEWSDKDKRRAKIFETQARAMKLALTLVGETRTDKNSRLIANRAPGSAEFKLLHSSGPGSAWNALKFSHQVYDVRLPERADVFAVLTTSPSSNDVRWRWYGLEHGKPKLMGHSGSPDNWMGLNHKRDASGRLRFEDSSHFEDGRPTKSVPSPRVWFHRLNDLQVGTAFFAPTLVDQALPGQRNEFRVDAFGLTPTGAVISYERKGKRFTAGFSGGTIRLERRELVGPQSGMVRWFIVNEFKDGSERWHLADDPSKSIWAYRHDERRVYYREDGYFYSETDAVSDFLSFRVRDEILSFFQLGSYLMRPDKLEESLGLESGTLFVLTKSDRKRMARAKRLAPKGVDVSKLNPPTIEVHKYLKSVSEPRVELALEARGDGVVAKGVAVRILGAGQSKGVQVASPDPRASSLTLKRSVRLLPGINQIEISVQDFNGLSDRTLIEVEYKPKVVKLPRLHAMVIATENYDDPGIPPLPLTQADAKTVEELVLGQSKKLFSEVKAHTFCQHSGCDRKPNRSSLIRGLRTLGESGEDGDVFMIYISGHGVRGQDGDYYFIPEDGNRAQLESMISWSELRALLADYPLGKKVVVLDTCHSGATLSAQQDKGRLIQQMADREGFYVISATAADENAFEMMSIGNGIFTHVLREGIDGAADASADGVVSFEELSFYIAREVRAVARGFGVEMQPHVAFISPRLDFGLMAVGGDLKVGIHIGELTSFDLRAKEARQRAWQRLFKGVKNIRWVAPADASLILTIVENGESFDRADIRTRSGEILGRFTTEQLDGVVPAFIMAIAASLREDS